MDDKKRRQTNDSDNSRQDSNDDHIKKDRDSTVTDWNRPPRPDKNKDRDEE
jgi:hypothetical protein